MSPPRVADAAYFAVPARRGGGCRLLLNRFLLRVIEVRESGYRNNRPWTSVVKTADREP